jgi:uncharacterized protein YggT (Ycf19 family)
MNTTTPNALIAVARIARALTYLVYAFALVTLVLLVLCFVLELFGANPDAPFAESLFRGLARAMAPFRGLFEPVPLDGRSVLDPSILFAMLVYGIVAFALGGLIGWLTVRILELRAGFTGRGRGTPQPLG